VSKFFLHPITLTALSFCLTSLALAGEAERSRFVIRGGDTAPVRAELSRVKGRFKRELQYTTGIVADLNASELTELKGKFPRLNFKKDRQAKVMGKPYYKKHERVIQETQPGLLAIKADQAWNTANGAGVTVCVVDTGIDRRHHDLRRNIAGGRNFVTNWDTGTLDASAWADDNGHGTHVSGIIAALDNKIGVVGVAPKARIFAVKTMDSTGTGYYSDIADGVRACIEQKTQVINMSLTGYYDDEDLHDAIKAAHQAGIVIVAAAGNDSTEVGYPARYPEVVAVSAVEQDLSFAYYSNYGADVDFTAPGSFVFSTVPGGYSWYSGTSMATPHVAGVAALMISAGRKDLRADWIKGLTAAQQGNGLIDAAASVQ
jgi:subtilisin family serine protease